MRNFVRFVLLMALVLPVVATAQEMPPMREPGPPGSELGKWWKNSEIVQQLALTQAQISQIEQSFLEQRLKLIDLQADVQKQEAKLQPLIEADQPDETKVSAQIDLLLTARVRLEKANAMMMFSIRRVLTVEQWKKLQEIQRRRENISLEQRREMEMKEWRRREMDERARQPGAPPRPPEPNGEPR